MPGNASTYGGSGSPINPPWIDRIGRMGPYMQQDLTAVEARVRRITHGACLVCVPWGLPSTRTYANSHSSSVALCTPQCGRSAIYPSSACNTPVSPPSTRAADPEGLTSYSAGNTAAPCIVRSLIVVLVSMRRFRGARSQSPSVPSDAVALCT